MPKCEKCGSELKCRHCKGVEAGKKRARLMFKGKTKEEISEMMKQVRRGK